MIEQLKRVFKHRWTDDTARTIPPAMVERLMHKVAASETRHSGEIRICIEAGLPNSYLLRDEPTRTLTRQRAVMQFGKLRVWDTEHNNGVLIYLLLAEHAIELVADRGLNQYVSAVEWHATVTRLGASMRAGRIEEGLNQALEDVSEQLIRHFPVQPGEANVNELPDRPSLS